ncbi:hypothetical protein [Promicromonospora sukumoe]|uniref:hypothetical protein n=1 Tax=Promicromonospora sukumoe TaxID=88382 RepID=UPI00365ADE93
MAWWRRKPRTADDDGTPTDAETADLMRRLADEFVRNSRGPDLFDYSVDSIATLDGLIDGLLEEAHAAALDKGFSLGMGAYVGEVIVRNSPAARWVYHVDQRTGAIESAQYLAFPVFKVSKRFTIGPEHSLVQFVRAAVNDEMPPEARRIS